MEPSPASATDRVARDPIRETKASGSSIGS
jgi:hypothetical protein